jgi:tripartite-type tricarboxylate transporter receptor subunit TctC
MKTVALAIGIGVAAAWIGCGSHAARAAEAVSFKGQTVTIVIGYGAGGSYDIYGRLAGRFLGKYLPGNPTVIAQNMTGAGSLIAANFLFNRAPKDGTYLGVIGQTIPVDQLLFEHDAQRFDSAKFNWIGRMASGAEAIVTWKTAPAKSIEEAKSKQAVIAATGPSSGSTIYPIVLNHLIGTNFKVVRGYAGTNEMLNAMERREVDGSGAVNVSTLTSQFNRWLTEKNIYVLTQISLVRHPSLPDVPTFVELGQTEQQKAILKLFAASGDVGRSILAPPGMAPVRVATLQAAFIAMMKDPELLAFARKTQIDLSPMDGRSLQTIIENIRSTPKQIVALAKTAQE